MAGRYWVGGTDGWDGTAGTKWALTSGGAGGQAIPGTADDVIFDAGSGACTVSINAGSAIINCKSISFTSGAGNFTGTFQQGTSNGVYIYGASGTGNCTLVSGMTLGNAVDFRWKGSSGGGLTSATKVIHNILGDTFGGTIVFNDDIRATAVQLIAGNTTTINTNGKTVTLAGDLTAGGGTFTITNSTISCLSADFTGLGTLNSSGSTITFTGVINQTFNGAGLTFNNIYNNKTSGILTISGSNIFNDFKSDGSLTTKITDSTTQTIRSLTIPGTTGNVVTFAGTSTGGYAVAKTGAVINTDYMSIGYMTGSPDLTWYVGTHSTDGGHNTHVYFTAPPAGSTGNFLAFF